MNLTASPPQIAAMTRALHLRTEEEGEAFSRARGIVGWALSHAERGDALEEAEAEIRDTARGISNTAHLLHGEDDTLTDADFAVLTDHYDRMAIGYQFAARNFMASDLAADLVGTEIAILGVGVYPLTPEVLAAVAAPWVTATTPAP